MTKTFLKKIVASALVMTTVFSTVGMLAPEAKAQMTVVDIPNTVQGTINAANTGISSYNTQSLQLKAFVLDTVATNIAKALIREITASVVNWINHGFEGSPSFLSNPGSFFTDVADQLTGAFLASQGLQSLCSPFSLDIRIALSFKYHKNQREKYECTLSKVIAASKQNKITLNGQNITPQVNGFMKGDFNQGGWPAFVSLTQDTQNNVYGAYLAADSELSVKVSSSQNQQRLEISAGNGFMSWRDKDCVDKVKQRQARLAAGTESEYYEGSTAPPQTTQDCPINTPGSVIVSSLETSVNGPMHELELVDSINQIVTALVGKLVEKVLQGGLTAISGSGPSDSSSYLNQIRAQANNSVGAQLASSKEGLIAQMSPYITNALTYKNNKAKSLALVSSTIAKYNEARLCYENKNISGTYADQIAQITATSSTLSNLSEKLTAETAQANQEYDTLVNLKNQITKATSTEAFYGASQVFTQRLLSRDLIDFSDINDSEQQYNSVNTITTPMKRDAEARLQLCKGNAVITSQR